MKKIKFTLENSLLKLPNVSPQLRKYLVGWEKALTNFNDYSKEELKLKTRENTFELK